MRNLTSLLHFIQEEHELIHSVSFKHFIFNNVRCDITFEGQLDDALIGLINIFISMFGAKLHSDFSEKNVKIYIISEFNIDKNGKDNSRNEK